MLHHEGRTIGEVFSDAAERFAGNPFLIVPADPERAYAGDGWIASYREVAASVDALVAVLRSAGLGCGDRVAVLLENRPQMLILKLALAACGISTSVQLASPWMHPRRRQELSQEE